MRVEPCWKKRKWLMIIEAECMLMYVIALVIGEKEFERQ